MKNRRNSVDEILATDVLVIGGGLAGLWAAKRVGESGRNVIVVDRGPGIGLAGQGYFAGGGIQALTPGENVNDYVQDLLSLGDGLYEQDLLEKIFLESWSRIEECQRMGIDFITEKDGRLRFIPQRGLKHNACYLAEPSGSGGRNMMAFLAKNLKGLGVNYLNRICITNLLKYGDAVCGAVGFGLRDGKFYVLKAKAVILATGNAPNFRSGAGFSHMLWGEGITMALQAGAELKNMEFTTIWVVPKRYQWEGITYLLPLGAEFVNEKGEHFMDRYSPVFKSNCDYNYLARAMAIEEQAGRGPFYLDCTAMTDRSKELMIPAVGWTKLQYDKLLKANIRPFDERQEWTAILSTISGGVHTDMEMRTAVPGLFVAGAIRNTDPGIYFGGWNICKTMAFGCWAGESAVKHIEISKPSSIDENEVVRLKSSIYETIGESKITGDAVLDELQNSIFPVVVIKNNTNLTNALKKVQHIKSELVPRMRAIDTHRLGKILGIKSSVLIAELMLTASLLRTETRASHYREDCPHRNDDWLKWIVLKMDGNKLNIRTEPVPLEKYKLKSWNCYSDNFRFPEKENK